MFVPATMAGEAVPLPPLATDKIPTTPVVNGRPVAFVKTPDAGVPSTAFTRVGPDDKTTEPNPVFVVVPVPPLATANVPVTPDAGTLVATIAPDPLAVMLAPVPTTIVAVVFVPVCSAAHCVLGNMQSAKRVPLVLFQQDGCPTVVVLGPLTFPPPRHGVPLIFPLLSKTAQ